MCVRVIQVRDVDNWGEVREGEMQRGSQANQLDVGEAVMETIEKSEGREIFQ